MAIELKIPSVGESITEVQIGEWLKAEGDGVAKDESVVTLESEKATVDLPAPTAGILVKILKPKGATARVGEVIAQLDPAGTQKPTESKPDEKISKQQSAPAGPKSEEAPAFKMKTPAPETDGEAPEKKQSGPRITPSAERLLAQSGLRAEEVQATEPGGRLLKEDVLRHREQTRAETPPTKRTATPSGGREEEAVPMSLLRRTVARRLVEAQHSAALLTTFNEVDMSSILALRKQFGETFQHKHGIKLGFMSFFVKAVIEGLKQFPQLNAEVRGTDVVYHNFFDIGVAIGSGKGLVVPVIRNAERLSFAEIEKAIADFASRAQEDKLKPDELLGGTFTISNGGIYGSLLSTPIVNPPQSGVLGMHAIQERPMAVEGNVVVRPMMYLALTYDHRIVDGREAVTFLKRLKEIIETPARILIEI